MANKISTITSLCSPAALAAALFAYAAVGNAAENVQAVYKAELQPLNSQVTEQKATGTAKLTVTDDSVIARIHVENVPANIVHWQHFHGFKDGHEASCATAAADSNGDEIVDLIETNPVSGKTMVPFDAKPAAMDIAHGKYPKASANGSYTYEETIPLKKLRNAVDKAYNAKLNLAHRVIYVHGVPANTNLPDSVASLGPIPAHVTLPIACGEFERVK